MRRLAILLLISVIASASPALADFNRTTGLIDIPTAEWLERNVVRGMLSTSFGIGRDMEANNHPITTDFGVSYGLFGVGEVVLDAYSSKDFSTHLALKIRDEKEWVPALGFGIHEITYRKWISSVGGEGDSATGPADNVDYWKHSVRHSEMFSFYLVATKDFHSFGSYTLGIGRGRFVGYGPRSYLFNTDMLFRGYADPYVQASSFCLGLFMGAKWELFPGFSVMMDFDGRDANLGCKYTHKYFEVGLAGTHLEQIGGYDSLNPRISFGLSANSSWLYELAKEGVIAGKVTDVATGKPLLARITFPKTEIPPVTTTPEGEFSVTLPVGEHVVQTYRDGYFWKRVRVKVTAETTQRVDFALKRKPTPEEIERAKSLKEHLGRGYAYLEQGRLREAASEWEAVLSLDPGHAEARSMMSRVRKLIELEVGAHRTKALGHASRGELSKAISEWEAVLNLDPGNREATSQIRELKAKLAAPKRPPPKRPPVKPPKPKVSPEEIAKIFNRGVSLFLAEEYEDALKAFKEVLDLDPKHEEARKYKEKTEARLKVLRGE